MSLRLKLLALAAALLLSPAAPRAQEIVQKQVFEAGSYRTRSGGVIANTRIGYQTMGRLNAAGDNAVLITHFFSGNSHAFGRLGGPQGPVGYWDAIIGPGRAIDTDRYFVVSSDTLANLNIPDPNTVTTGPATIDPGTGRPYGLTFPVVSMRDFVEVQKRLLDHLGVRRLALVAGASMGALQAMEWAAAYPEMVARVMPVIAHDIDPWNLAWLDVWEAPIRMDPNWRQGDYYAQGRQPPLAGLAEALRIVTLQSRDRQWARGLGTRPAEGNDPARNLLDRFAIEKWLDDAALARARTADANAFLYLVRANQLFFNEYDGPEAAFRRSQARWLVVPSANDRVFPIEGVREMVETLRRVGRPVEVAEVAGPLGHLNGVANMGPLADRIRAFLAE
ncbi:MAG TPA: homoserine O-acetyltransferase [Roseomonas sp.]|jgi:homoserine O-acetyltransferase